MSATEPPDSHATGPRVATLVTAILASLALGVAAVAALAWWIGGSQGAAAVRAVSVHGTSTDVVDPEGYSVWGRNADGSPIRWDPCSPVELVVASGAPPGSLDDLDTAVARVREATGLDVAIVGATDEEPSRNRLPFQPERYGQRWAPVLVGWSTPAGPDSPLRDTDRGVAIPVAVGREGDRTYVTGQVVFNLDRDDLRVGFADRADSWGATILHELAHLLGLGHVDDPEELMYTFPGSGPIEWGPGDRRGLAAVGADGGCRRVPRAQPVDVDPS